MRFVFCLLVVVFASPVSATRFWTTDWRFSGPPCTGSVMDVANFEAQLSTVIQTCSYAGCVYAPGVATLFAFQIIPDAGQNFTPYPDRALVAQRFDCNSANQFSPVVFDPGVPGAADGVVELLGCTVSGNLVLLWGQYDPPGAGMGSCSAATRQTWVGAFNQNNPSPSFLQLVTRPGEYVHAVERAGGVAYLFCGNSTVIFYSASSGLSRSVLNFVGGGCPSGTELTGAVYDGVDRFWASRIDTVGGNTLDRLSSYQRTGDDPVGWVKTSHDIDTFQGGLELPVITMVSSGAGEVVVQAGPRFLRYNGATLQSSLTVLPADIRAPVLDTYQNAYKEGAFYAAYRRKGSDYMLKLRFSDFALLSEYSLTEEGFTLPPKRASLAFKP